MKALPKSQILRFTEKAIHLARRAVSRYSPKFSKHRYRLPQHVVLLCLKVTLLVDTKENVILNLHVTTTRKHDSQIAPSLIKRNPETTDILLGDNGCDDQKIRRLARRHEIRPLIKRREFTPLHRARNGR